MKQRDRKGEMEGEQPQRENKKKDKKERKTASPFAPTCLDLKEELGGENKDAWEDLKRGTKTREKEEERGRGKGKRADM